MLNFFTRTLMLLLSALCLSQTSAIAAEYLSVEDAFPMSITAKTDKVIFEWQIQDGYYLYASKFKFKALDDHTFGDPIIPKGAVKTDEFLGQIELLRGHIQIEVPFTSNTDNNLIAKISIQGCSDDGFCYPPHHKKTTIALPQDTAISSSPLTSSLQQSLATTANPFDQLNSLANDYGLEEQDEILPASEAYIYTATLTPDQKNLQIQLKIAEGTYLYEDKFSFEIKDSNQVTLGQITLPKPKIKPQALRLDGTIGELAVYVKKMDFQIPLQRTTTEAIDFTLNSKYQGCADLGVCYPPQRQSQAFRLDPIDPQTELERPKVSDTTSTASTNNPPQAPLNEQDQIAQTLQSGNLWLIIGSFFVFGLLLSLTPCIFPMIPILSGIIAGQGTKITTQRSFMLSLVYVLAMAMTYTAAGILAGLFGQNLTILFQNPWILSSFAGVFVLLALSMFGFYELQLPSSVQTKLNNISNQQSGGSYLGVAIMGLLSALIVGPCVAPPLAAALIYIGQTGDATLGGIALFALSIGMGVPLLLIGASAGSLLPRAGGWMDTVKAVFGVGMLAVAIIMLERIISPTIAMLLWGVLLIVSAIYMGALKQLANDASGWMSLWKGIGVVLLVYGTLMLLGVAMGGKDTVQPLRGLSFNGQTSSNTTQHREIPFERIKSLADLEQKVAEAAKANKPVMLDFYADWCVSCKEMERYTFTDPKVLQALEGFILLQADVTADDEQDRALLQGHFNMPGPPSIMFYNRQGNELKQHRVVGFKNAAEFTAIIKQVATP